jgi:hypothetical protein
MEPNLTVVHHETVDRDELLVRDWRVTQPGAPGTSARRLLAKGLNGASPWES